MRFGISVAWGKGSKRNHLSDGFLAEVKPVRYPVNGNATNDLLNRLFSPQHCRFDGDPWRRQARVPLAPSIFLDYLEAGEDEHREPVDAIDHARINLELTEQTVECGGLMEIEINSHAAVSSWSMYSAFTGRYQDRPGRAGGSCEGSRLQLKC